MNPFLFGILGVVIQGVGLVFFVLVSRTNAAVFGKPTILFITGLAVCVLLWEGTRRARGVIGVCLIPVNLALGYMVAYHLVGFICFPRLVSDARGDPIDYLWIVLHVTGSLTLYYAAGTVLFFSVNWCIRKMRLPRNKNAPKLY